jgi:ABC-type cobalamin transport system permease subunit
LRRNNLKGGDMTKIKSGGPVRKFITRVLATASLLAIYGFGTIATTGVVLTTGVSTAFAQRGRGRGRGRGIGIGTAIGIGVGAAIVGGAIAADQAARSDAVEYCMRRFRSYNPETGTYIGFDGQPHPCP